MEGTGRGAPTCLESWVTSPEAGALPPPHPAESSPAALSSPPHCNTSTSFPSAAGVQGSVVTHLSQGRKPGVLDPPCRCPGLGPLKARPVPSPLHAPSQARVTSLLGCWRTLPSFSAGPFCPGCPHAGPSTPSLTQASCPSALGSNLPPPQSSSGSLAVGLWGENPDPSP